MTCEKVIRDEILAYSPDENINVQVLGMLIQYFEDLGYTAENLLMLKGDNTDLFGHSKIFFGYSLLKKSLPRRIK